MSDSKKVKLIRIGDLEPECPKCTGSNAMLPKLRLISPPRPDDPRFSPTKFGERPYPPHAIHLVCRDCDFKVEEKDAEIEEISMKEGQERLRKYGSLFPY